jgi:hypothetical protein
MRSSDPFAVRIDHTDRAARRMNIESEIPFYVRPPA